MPFMLHRRMNVPTFDGVTSIETRIDWLGASLRQTAAIALGRIGPGAKDAAPELLKLLKDPGEDVRRAAAEALGRIGCQKS